MLKPVLVQATLFAAQLLFGCAEPRDDECAGASCGANDGGEGDVTLLAPMDGGNTATGCSADLRTTLDATGDRIADCDPDQACAKGVCVPACAAYAETKGSLGCDYVVSTPQSNNDFVQPCFAMFLANGWAKDVHITVSRAGAIFDVSQFGRIPVEGQPPTAWDPVPLTGLPPGKTAVLFLSSDPRANASFDLDTDAGYAPPGRPMTCPITPAVNGATAVPGGGHPHHPVTGRGQAFHIQTDYPVTAYDMLPFGGAYVYLSGASLLFPTSAWGSNYFGVVPLQGLDTAQVKQWGQVVAASDGTTVTVLPNVDLPTGPAVDPAPHGVTTTYTLNAGEFIQWQDSSEMSSTIISADKPIAFIGGHECGIYGGQDWPVGTCDGIHQQIPPIAAFGSTYAVAEYTTRRKDLQSESIPYRIVGAVDGTTLTYDYMTYAPATVHAGEVIDFVARSSFVVRSQDSAHPFYIGQHMTSGDFTGCVAQDDAGLDGGFPLGCADIGDPELVNVLPAAQYLSRYLFFTDPTYSTTNLVFTRAKDKSGFHDVTLDCLGKVTGWTKMGYAGDFETTNVDLVRAGVKNGACDNGSHTASSDAPFGLTVWGLDQAVSYAFPAGGRLAPINAVVLPPK